MSIGRLEGAHSGRFVALAGEERIEFPSPAELSIEEISVTYETEGGYLFSLAAQGVPGITWPAIRGTFYAWLDHHDLPDEPDLRRLLWLLDRYTDGVEVDLAWRGYDLRELWRARDLRRLLLLIDALPLASHTKEALHTDEEYARLVKEAAKARKAAGEKDDPRSSLPPLREHTPEVAALLRIADLLKQVRATIIAVNMTKGTPPKVEPEPRPWTAHKALDEVERMRKAQSIVDRVLPGKRRPGDQ